MTVANCHVAFEVRESSQVGEVRRVATRVADYLGFDETARGRVALIATELGTNLVRHASQGRILVAAVKDEKGAMLVELLSIDEGPGMANIGGCMTDGYSTGGTPGTGLGAIRRLADEFDAFSAVSAGTVILARVAAKQNPQTGAGPEASQGASAFRVGAIALAAPNEVVCGDAWSFAQHGTRVALMVADGLGHGPYAAEASTAATKVFAEMAFSGPSVALERVHRDLRSTRGAAVAMAEIDLSRDKLMFAGAGNIVGRLMSGVEDRSLLSQHGTAGLQIGHLQDIPYDWPQHGMLVMHSDGLTTRWKLDGVQQILQHHPSVIAGWLIRDHSRGRDDATVVVLKKRSAQ